MESEIFCVLILNIAIKTEQLLKIAIVFGIYSQHGKSIGRKIQIAEQN